MFPDLDAAYMRLVETQSRVRSAVATVATSRKRLQLEIERLEREAGERDGQGRAGMEAGHDGMPGADEEGRDTAEARLGELRGRYAGIRAQEARVAAASGRLQAEINAFRDARKAIEASYAAAQEAAEAVLAACQNEAENTGIER